MNIINLSDHVLTTTQNKVLKRGLSFSPVHDISPFTLYKDLFLFCRKLLLKKHFNKDSNPEGQSLVNPLMAISDSQNPHDLAYSSIGSTQEQTMLDQAINDLQDLLLEQTEPTHSLKPKSRFMPPRNTSSAVITFGELVMRDFMVLSSPYNDNLSRAERQALQEIASWEDVIIKPSDKGGNIVIWPRVMYLTEALKQLNDRSCYKKLPSDPSIHYRSLYNGLITDGFQTGLISKSEHKSLLNLVSVTPTFYMLPKVHKNLQKPPGRPIVSGNGNLCEKASQFIDMKLRKFVVTLPSYIRDTGDLLSKLSHVKIDKGTLLVGCDVESLYSSISHKQGLQAIRFFMETESDWGGEFRDFLADLTDFCLNHNFFIFHDKFYLQTRGVAMGAAFAPTYANLFMGWWEANYVFSDQMSPYVQYISHWFRYIDDLVFLWSGDMTSLTEFLCRLNDNNLNIKLTHIISEKSLDFLDVTLIIQEDGSINTDLYRKPTATNSILHFTSHHPMTTKRGIPVGEFLRLRRNCSDLSTFKIRASELTERLQERGYSLTIIRKAYSRAIKTPRNSLLQGRDRSTAGAEQPVRFIGTFCKQWPMIETILKRHWHILHTDPVLDNILGSRPLTCCRRAPNLRDRLVKSHLTRLSIKPLRVGTFACGRCRACIYMHNEQPVIDRFGKRHRITQIFTCMTNNVIYMLTCPCNKVYIGKTTRPFKKRLLEHVSSINNAPEWIQNNRKLPPVSRHFLEFHNNSSTGLRAMGLQRISLGIRGGDIDTALLSKESEWIFRMNALGPMGLNESITMNIFI